MQTLSMESDSTSKAPKEETKKHQRNDCFKFHLLVKRKIITTEIGNIILVIYAKRNNMMIDVDGESSVTLWDWQTK
jgi:hypothetical protein